MTTPQTFVPMDDSPRGIIARQIEFYEARRDAAIKDRNQPDADEAQGTINKLKQKLAATPRQTDAQKQQIAATRKKYLEAEQKKELAEYYKEHPDKRPSVFAGVSATELAIGAAIIFFVLRERK